MPSLMDAHTHILPDMDDGSDSAEESLELIRLSREANVKAVCMTPHFYPGNESPRSFLDRREQSIKTLETVLKGEEDIPRIHFGAEVEFFEGISRVSEIEELTIGSSGILLIEMPFTKWTDRMIRELYELRDYREVTPLIAHVDRYLDFGNEDRVDEFNENGILIQANASFFLKGFASRRAMRMIKKEKIQFLGSDCHNLRSRRPNLKEAAEKILSKCGKDSLDYLKNYQDLINAR